MNTPRNRLRLVLILLLLLVPLLSTHTTLSQDAAPACSAIVRRALDNAKEQCQAAGRNQACYGHTRLEAEPQPQVEQFNFDQEGDITDIPNIRTMRLSAMQAESDIWGVALMRVRTNAINHAGRQDATMILFGDVEITNSVSPGATTVTFTVHTADQDARIRNAPWGGTISALSDGDTVMANGRLANNSWVRIALPFGVDRLGWIHASLLDDPSAIERLEVVEPDSALYAPMQAFYFRSGQDDAACEEAPNSGLLIQTPEGEGRIVFLINEVAIDMGSTVYFEASPGGDMSVAVVEGSARVQAGNKVSYATAGSQIDVPLNAAGKPAGPPSPPKAYNTNSVRSLPVENLDRPVTVHPPLSEEQLTDLHAIQEEMTQPDVLETVLPDQAQEKKPAENTDAEAEDDLDEDSDAPDEDEGEAEEEDVEEEENEEEADDLDEGDPDEASDKEKKDKEKEKAERDDKDAERDNKEKGAIESRILDYIRLILPGHRPEGLPDIKHIIPDENPPVSS